MVRSFSEDVAKEVAGVFIAFIAFVTFTSFMPAHAAEVEVVGACIASIALILDVASISVKVVSAFAFVSSRDPVDVAAFF